MCNYLEFKLRNFVEYSDDAFSVFVEVQVGRHTEFEYQFSSADEVELLTVVLELKGDSNFLE